MATLLLVLWTLLLRTIDTLAPYNVNYNLYHGYYSPVRRTLLLCTMDTLALYDGHYNSVRWTL